ncbi:MAG: hypothetical protein HKN37_01560 [Rhodothermales bacterium]|nr:hypothetical protein [Rhodothermales bacterium]
MMNSRQSEIRSGAVVNALGLAGRLAGPAFLILVNRLYGVEVFGVYITAVSLVEMSIAFLTAGFRDGALLFVARHSDGQPGRDNPALYQALVNALAWSLLFAVGLIALTAMLGASVVPRFFPEFGDRLLLMLRWMVLVMPLMAFDRIVLGATQGLKIMKYEAAVNGVARPALLVILAGALWNIWPSEIGIVMAYVFTQCSISVIAVFVFNRELSWRSAGQAIRSFRPSGEMLRFALPQNLNRTLEQFITNIDVVMLGMLGYGASTIGLYGAGALIVREIRHVKLVFSSAFAPHIVQLYHGRRMEELSRAYSVTSRWIATWAIPIVLAVVILRGDLLRVVHPDFSGEDTQFMLLLLLIPYLQCSLGLAGNIVVMTGHSGYNLFNSVTTASANVLLNLWWIPLFGPFGAAAASALAAVLTRGLELAEMRWVIRARALIKEMFAPHLAGLLGLAAIVTTAQFTTYTDQFFPGRLVVALISIAVYLAALGVLRAAGIGRSSLPT